jgi:hypothetical protein
VASPPSLPIIGEVARRAGEVSYEKKRMEFAEKKL